MAIEVQSHAYGREGQLAKFNADRNNPNKPSQVRKWADDAHKKIVAQLEDKQLMAMRERLIKASRAGDLREQAKIMQIMKAHTGEDRETGLYEQG